MKKNTIALFVGSFDPFHKGHFNILQKSEEIFGKGNVHVCFGVNPDKHNISFENKESPALRLLEPIKQKVKDLEEKLGSPVKYYLGFLHDYVTELEEKGFDPVVIRGLRNGDDLNYEVNQLRFISDFKKGIKTIFIVCDKEYEHISSSAIRKLYQFGGDEAIKKYVI
jgi:pantetheine-phosphate adenylyltransferase